MKTCKRGHEYEGVRCMTCSRAGTKAWKKRYPELVAEIARRSAMRKKEHGKRKKVGDSPV